LPIWAKSFHTTEEVIMKPVGHCQKPHAVYLDDALQRYTHIYPAGGAHNAIFRVTLAQLAHMSGGTFVDVKRDPAQT
jgi:prolyl-tRNA editing enzyme YbaK/EbsC (Cys-tRNA(Pro) deacylase)